MQDPLRVDEAFKSIEHVIIPYELSARRGAGTRIGSHLGLKGEGGVVRVAKVEVAGEIHILKDLQVSKISTVYMNIITVGRGLKNLDPNLNQLVFTHTQKSLRKQFL